MTVPPPAVPRAPLDARFALITDPRGDGLQRLVAGQGVGHLLPPIVADFVASLLQLDPNARPSAADALRHPFLASEDGLRTALRQADEARQAAAAAHAAAAAAAASAGQRQQQFQHTQDDV